MFTIYLITNTVNGKVYVGQTCASPRMRFAQHKSNARTQRGDGLLQLAMRKHGSDRFVMSVIASCDSKKEADRLEMRWIRKCRANHRSVGYNLTDGGGGKVGNKHRPETKAKMSATRLGRKFTAAHRAALSAARKGFRPKPESVAKSAASKRGSVHRPESKEKISRSLREHWAKRKDPVIG